MLFVLSFSGSAIADSSATSGSVASAGATGGSSTSGAAITAPINVYNNFPASPTNTTSTIKSESGALPSGAVGMGRLLLNLPNIPVAPLINYFGPWKETANILETNLGLPTKVSMTQAKNAYQGGATSRLNILNPVKFTVENCELLTQIPVGSVTRGFTFLKGNGDASTIDVLMKAYMDAMEAGATKIVILKKQASTKNSAFGVSLGLGGGVSSLAGTEKESGLTVGGGTGISWGSSEPSFKDGMAVLMIE
jgi:hypothetical protein